MPSLREGWYTMFGPPAYEVISGKGPLFRRKRKKEDQRRPKDVHNGDSGYAGRCEPEVARCESMIIDTGINSALTERPSENATAGCILSNV